MSGDVQQTLNELERKLRELQAELRGTDAEPDAPPPPLADRPYVQEPPPHEPPLSDRPYVQPPTAHQAPPPPPRSPLQDQLDELLRFRDQLAEAANRLVEDYSRLVEQLERVAQAPPPPTPASGHVTFPVPPPAPTSTEGTLFGGQVVVEAAPFDDIGPVAALEAALRSVAHAEDVHVRSFDEGRAVFDVRLGGEVPLVFELRRASDQGFDVEHAEPGRLELAMHAPGELPPFPMRP